MIRLGLTGSIGMGKTTTAAMFATRGIPVFNADETVHRLYQGDLAPVVEAAFPGVVTDGVVDRARLAAAVLGNPEALKRLEAIVHPAVRAEEQAFLESAETSGATIALLDIPLLYEAGRDRDCDKVVLVTCDPAIQRTRVLARPGMTEEKFAAILARQMPDAEKRQRADFIIDTGSGFEAAQLAVDQVIEHLTSSVD